MSVLSRLEDTASLAAAGVALFVFLALGRRHPRPLLITVLLVGIVGPIICVSAAVGMAIAGSGIGATHVVGYLATAAVLVPLARSVLRSRQMLAELAIHP